MNSPQIKTMRDALVENIYRKMHDDQKIFFLSADLGAPALDKLREDFKDRFINVGIAEQNAVNIAAGLALEGFTVYVYAIAGFLAMRAYEQIRTNLALSCQQQEMNVNLVGVGAGVSYDMSGPSHYCLEDISIIRTLPNIMLCSPADWVTARSFVDFSISVKKPKYIRLDSKPLPQIYEENQNFEWQKGFFELLKGEDVCIVSTGYTTHKALEIAQRLRDEKKSIGVIDLFMMNPVDEDSLYDLLKGYKTVVTIEEGFINSGGMDSLIMNILKNNESNIKLKNFGFGDKYLFQSGGRASLYNTAGLCDEDIISALIS